MFRLSEPERNQDRSSYGLGFFLGGLMGKEWEAAIRYRLHAEDLRSIARDKDMGFCRVTLIEVAGQYEQVARNLETIDRIIGAAKLDFE